jgi:hypothetical protein
MARSMAKLLSPLSRAKLATALVVDRQPRPSRLAPRLARAARQQLLLHLLVATALLSGANVAVKGKQKLFYALDLHAASLAALANRVGSTTLSVSSFAACANLC